METLNTILLGVIQGLTEFLPVSSSGHLILAQTFLGMDAAQGAGSAMFLEVLLHVATGLAVLFVFRQDIFTLVRGYFSRDLILRRDSFRYSAYIVVATIPAAVCGIFLGDVIENLYDVSAGKNAAYLAASMLFVTAALLFSTKRKDRRRHSDDADNAIGIGGGTGVGAVNAPASINFGNMTLVTALIIGLVQAVAIMPGISRSGSTIAVALLLGITRSEAGRFSFMLALPAIFGGALLDARKVESWGSALSLNAVLGFVAAFAVGLFALKFLLSFIKKGKLHYFGYYCAAAATVAIVWLVAI